MHHSGHRERHVTKPTQLRCQSHSLPTRRSYCHHQWQLLSPGRTNQSVLTQWSMLHCYDSTTGWLTFRSCCAAWTMCYASHDHALLHPMSGLMNNRAQLLHLNIKQQITILRYITTLNASQTYIIHELIMHNKQDTDGKYVLTMHKFSLKNHSCVKDFLLNSERKNQYIYAMLSSSQLHPHCRHSVTYTVSTLTYGNPSCSITL